MSLPLLETRFLSCKRAGKWLFRGLSLQMYSNHLYRVSGENGSGKTTLLRILAGVYRAQEGGVFWNRQNIHAISKPFHKTMSYIGHKNGLAAELNPIENLCYYLALEQQDKKTTSEQLKYIRETLSQFGMLQYQYRPVGSLSQGQQRRVALARLAITAKNIWLLDEPYSYLDKKAKMHLNHLLIQHTKKGGIAVIASHEPIQTDIQQETFCIGDNGN